MGTMDDVLDRIEREISIETVRLDRPCYAAYRWLGESTGDGETATTFVEFWVVDVDVTLRGGRERLRVVTG